jgi:hypothetical protein
MSYKKSEKKNYKSENKNPVPIIVDCMQNGNCNTSKIQEIYTNIRKECGLMQKKPAYDVIHPFTHVSDKPVLYGSAMYQINGAVITFKVFKLFDPLEEKMNESRRTDPWKKYLSTTRMEIFVKSKDSTLVDRINEIIGQYSS